VGQAVEAELGAVDGDGGVGSGEVGEGGVVLNVVEWLPDNVLSDAVSDGRWRRESESKHGG
jgi:hypothetical protein